MPNDAEVLLHPDAADAPTRKPSAPQARAAVLPAAPEKALRSSRRSPVRWALFALLPLALTAGGYWHVTGGQVMSTDDAYVQADTVGLSTDVAGIVKEIDVSENQHV